MAIFFYFNTFLRKKIIKTIFDRLFIYLIPYILSIYTFVSMK